MTSVVLNRDNNQIMSKIVMTMDQLPVEILEIILEYVIWDNPDELYWLLRTVSHTWKSAIERSRSRIFNYWYNRCKAEIPEDHLADIIQAKYPLVAHPWQERYWLDHGLVYVAKNAYDIWQGFPTIEQFDASKLNFHWPSEDFPENFTTIGMNDKYFATSSHYDGYGHRRGTQIYRWDKLDDLPIRRFDFVSNKIDFYTTKKGTFIVLAHSDSTDNDSEIHASKYPIENQDCSLELILLGRSKKYCITQNECFYINESDSTASRVVEHKVLTEGGFETNTIIEPPAEMPQHAWQWMRVEICGCTLYIMQNATEKFSIAKYKISRNSDGKLSFTFEELQILDLNDEGYNGALRVQLEDFFHIHICSENLNLTDMAFNASAKFNPWLYYRSRRTLYAETVHANYVFCAHRIFGEISHISIIQKDNLIECMAADDFDNLKRAFIRNLSYDIHNREPEINWISIIYIGLKAKILVQFDSTCLALIDFY